MAYLEVLCKQHSDDAVVEMQIDVRFFWSKPHIAIVAGNRKGWVHSHLLRSGEAGKLTRTYKPFAVS